MKPLRPALWLCALAVILVSVPAPAGDDAVTILNKLLDRPYKDLTLDVQLVKISKSGREREMELTVQLKKTPELTRTRAEFTAPPEVAGIVSLSWAYADKPADRWFKLSGLDYVKCVGQACQKMEDRFGFTTEVFAVNTKEADHKLLGEETVDGASCYKIQSTPHDPQAVGSSRIITWVDKEKYAARKVETYDLQGNLQKTSAFTAFTQINGKWWESQGSFDDLQSGKKLRYTIKSAKADTDIPDSVFDPPKSFKVEGDK